MDSKVYFANNRQRFGSNLFGKMEKLMDAAGFDSIIKKGGLTAIKVHWGELGNLAYIPAPVVRRVVDRVKGQGGKPFITDTNTLYNGTRRNAVDNMETAYANGFTPGVVGAPVIVADGLFGHDFSEVRVDARHFKTVRIAGGIFRADAMVAITHVKGHIGTGMGGTLKNIGMGCGAPTGKQKMHSDVKPKVTEKNCKACGECLKACPEAAISQTERKKAFIDEKKCIGCAECVVACRFDAIEVNWDSDSGIMQEKMVEYALGAVAGKQNKCMYFNFIYNVTPDCDCCDFNDAPFVPDIGVLLSADPVAVDQAAADLVNAAPWIDVMHKKKKPDSADKFVALRDIDWTVQVRYAEELGLGSRTYELVEIK